MGFLNSISRPGNLWNLSEGHGKAICFLRIKGQNNKKLKKVLMSQKQTLISVEKDTSTHFIHCNDGKYGK